MFSMIVANDVNGGIGNDLGLPWPRHQQDMNWVKEHTKDAILIVGRKTYESLPKAVVSGEYNNNTFIVITTTRNYTVPENAHTCVINPNGIGSNFVSVSVSEYFETQFDRELTNTINKITRKTGKKNVIVFGGSKVYNLLLDKVDMLYLSTFQESFDCDTFIDRDKFVNAMPYCGYREENEDVVFEIYYRDPLVIDNELAPTLYVK